jgi:hypothetical protein
MAIEVSLGNDPTPEQLSAEADADLAAFESWFIKSVDVKPLHNAEKAIIKSFLYWKMFRQARAPKL